VDSAALTLILTLAVASIAMVVAMVQFSIAIVFAAQRPAAIKLWGFVYLIAWAAIVFVIVRGAMMANATWPQALAVVTLAAGGWGTFHAFWVWLGLSLERTNARAAGQAVPLAPAKERICGVAGRLAAGGLVAVALAVIELGYARKVIETMIAPGHRAIAATASVAAVGFFLLMFGGLRLVLRRGEAMSRAEIDEQPRGLRLGRSTYRHLGPAAGAKAQQELSITEMTRAWRSGEWRRDPNLLNMFIMTAGGLLMIYGGFGVAIVATPLIMKVLCAGVLAFTTFKLIDAVRRA
jgi:hypothetical protein